MHTIACLRALSLSYSLSPCLPLLLLQLLKGIRIGEHLTSQTPDLLGGLLQGAGGFALEHVEAGQKIVGTAPVLQAGD